MQHYELNGVKIFSKEVHFVVLPPKTGFALVVYAPHKRLWWCFLVADVDEKRQELFVAHRKILVKPVRGPFIVTFKQSKPLFMSGVLVVEVKASVSCRSPLFP